MTTDNDLAAQLAALQATVADLKAQTDNLYKKHGYPSWEIEKKQRRDNERSRATRLPFSPSQAHGDVPSNKPVTN